MTLVMMVTAYATLNLLLIVAYLGLRFSRGHNSERSELRLHYIALSLILVLSALFPLLPKTPVFEPTVKVWSAPSLTAFKENTFDEKRSYFSVPVSSGKFTAEGTQVASMLLVLFTLSVSFAIYRVGRDLLSFGRLRRHAYLVRRFHSLRIYLTPEDRVPFSYWTPGRGNVMIPESFISDAGSFRIAILHELQHLRQGDTYWVYVMALFRAFCPWNPISHLWSLWLSEIQEFACDEALVGRKKVESRRYARLLVEVAESALNRKPLPACVTGLGFAVGRSSLKRRILKMLSHKHNRSPVSWTRAGVLVALLTVAAFASQGVIQDRRVSEKQAQALLANAKSESGFPVVVNDLVVAELNRYVGTPEGRTFMKESLARMQTHRAVIEPKIKAYQVPEELMAIPLIESGYQNLKKNNKAGQGAGLWMFLAETARDYGLKVTEKEDERLDTEKLTDAAMRYLKGGREKYNDWLLSILAYNMGNKAVDKGIQKTGSRDAWTLVRAGHENDKGYLPKLMAGILIIKNPKLLD